MLTNRMAELRESLGLSWRKQNQCDSKPAFLNPGGNSRLNMQPMYTTGRHYVATIGRPHTSSCMVISRQLSILKYLVVGHTSSFLLKYKKTNWPQDLKL